MLPAHMDDGVRVSGGAAEELGRVLQSRAVHALFQPLVDLDTGVTVGFEALSRGPVGSALANPAALFEAAYAAGRVAELDWLCRATALGTALNARLSPDLLLFVNTEPQSTRASCPDDLRAAVTAGERRLRVVMEVTERAVTADPAGLLAAVARMRAAGCRIALDDVGADPASLAVMPFISPDVIKLDLRLIQEHPDLRIARIVNAVRAHAERTGARILAEGIETPDHRDVARAMGATIGQGWLFGRPGPLTPPPAPTGGLPHPLETWTADGPPATATTPFEVVAAHRPVGRSRKELLLPMSRLLEDNGLDADEPIVLIGCFQDVRHFTPHTRRRFGRLADTATFVGALGAGMPAEPEPGVRGGELASDDPLRGEWDVVAIGPHFAGALVARDCGDSGPDRHRRFDYTITHDRELVIQAANTLLGRLAPI